MNRALALSMTVHAVGFLAVLAVPQSHVPRWQAPNTITVGLAAPASRPKSVPAAAVEPTPAEPAVEPAAKASHDPVEAKATPAKKLPAMRPAAPRTIRRDAPRRQDGPTLEERIRRRLEDVEASEEPAPAAPAPASAGSGSTAEVQAVQGVDFPYAWYLNLLRTRITDSWDPPGESLLTGRANKVLIAFRLYRDGRVTDVRVDGASGTPGLDASARRAVDRAQPFPPLPDTYGGDFLDVAVRFTAKGSP
ncbi:MAG: TonB family protein [bacterium]